MQICLPRVQRQVRAITIDCSALYRDPRFRMRGKMYSLGTPPPRPRNNIVMTPINWLHLCGDKPLAAASVKAMWKYFGRVICNVISS